MNVKTTLKTVALGLLVIASLVPAFAQYNSGFYVSIPFTYTAGGRTFSPGEYFVRTSLDGIVTIHGDGQDASVVLISYRAGDSKPGEQVRLVFHRYGGVYYLSQVWAPSAGGLELPKTKAEQEQLARVGAGSPVNVTARK